LSTHTKTPAKRSSARTLDLSKQRVKNSKSAGSTSLSKSWYDYPQYYDLGFRDDSPAEAHFFEQVFQRLIPFPVRRVLEPGCGTGRLVVEMAKRGYEMTGMDLNQKALAYGSSRLKRSKLQATMIQGDMTRFSLPVKYDAAFNPINTFRHLITEKQALDHLKCMALHLRPGAIYILGFHLLPPDGDLDCTERWTAKKGSTEIKFTLRVREASRRTRIEHLRISMLVRQGDQTLRLRDDFPLRMYSAAQFKALLAKVPEFQLAGVYDFWYEIDEPQVLNNDLSDAVFLLRRV
jgi:SAM-dependent methyltransferase